jgi:hypothetical protein
MNKTRQKPRTAIRTLFRMPTGLADGLALKELAPHITLDVTRPTQLGPPLPGMTTGDSALPRHCIPPCRVLFNGRSAGCRAGLINFLQVGARRAGSDADMDNG